MGAQLDDYHHFFNHSQHSYRDSTQSSATRGTKYEQVQTVVTDFLDKVPERALLNIELSSLCCHLILTSSYFDYILHFILFYCISRSTWYSQSGLVDEYVRWSRCRQPQCSQPTQWLASLYLFTLYENFTFIKFATLIPSSLFFPVPPEEQYATQLSQLREMGFYDTEENIGALRATSGNVHAAVERLLGNPGQ